MKPPLHFSQLCSLLALLVACLLLVGLAGCGHRSRPASSLSEKDRTLLAKYESIRAALVEDDLRAAKRAATDLGTYLKPAPDSPATPLDKCIQEITDARDLDKARMGFKTLSASVIPSAEGVSGYYVMDSPSADGAKWVQTMPKPDNPYMGKVMRDSGAPHH